MWLWALRITTKIMRQKFSSIESVGVNVTTSAQPRVRRLTLDGSMRYAASEAALFCSPICAIGCTTHDEIHWFYETP